MRFRFRASGYVETEASTLNQAIERLQTQVHSGEKVPLCFTDSRKQFRQFAFVVPILSPAEVEVYQEED